MQPANAVQRAYWNSDDSREWVDSPHRYDDMLAPFADALLTAVTPVTGERVLDIGCGNGATTLMFANEVGAAGESVGVDLSEAMIANARARAAEQGITNATFAVADAQVDDLGAPYDIAVSRFGIMFFDDPDAACANVVGALRTGGRVAITCWRTVAENEWVRVQAAAVAEHVALPQPTPGEPGPFRYSDPAPLVRSLERGGLAGVEAAPFDTSILLGGRGTFDDTMAYVASSGMLRRFLTNADDEQRGRAIATVRTALERFRTDDGVRLGAAVWVVSGRRR
ncbi:MAG TPA: class I SAM-dependent methyltransferase [Acidimicrobiia bacterium]